MAEFNLHPRLDADRHGTDDAESLLSEYVESHDAVSEGTAPVEQSGGEGVVVPDQFLEIEGIELFAETYQDLVADSAVVDVALWGPTAERFPVRVQHYALQQISQPDLYEFHAIDGQVTLVIAESQREAEQLHQDVPGAALG
jgi:hypothetical protein